MKQTDKNKYANPYVAGFLLGLVLLAAFYLTGRGLGASGAVKSVVVTAVKGVSESHVESKEFYAKYNESHDGIPIKAWLVFLAGGVLLGGAVSGIRAGRFGFKIDKGPNISVKLRLFLALAGGALFGFGAQLGRGCTSGSALSGMAVLSTAGFVSMLSIFGGAFLFAYFFRKLWI